MILKIEYLCECGLANRQTVASYWNRADWQGLSAYLDACQKIQYAQWAEEARKQDREFANLCRRIVDSGMAAKMPANIQAYLHNFIKKTDHV